MKYPELLQQYLAIELVILLRVVYNLVREWVTAFRGPYSKDFLVGIDKQIDVFGIF